jgi:tRNA(Arg) A34 adenosine deaminase TadA
MCTCDRRLILAYGLASLVQALPLAAATDAQHRSLIVEAFRMKDEAVAGGDQPFGAVVARGGIVIGFGPSRVIRDQNPDAHAERVALWDAQRRSGSEDLTGAVIYSTSRPCSACRQALARANIDRMYAGSHGADNGRPRTGS